MLQMYLSKIYPTVTYKNVSYKNVSKMYLTKMHKKYLTVQKTFTYIRLSGFSTICDDISGKEKLSESSQYLSFK